VSEVGHIDILKLTRVLVAGAGAVGIGCVIGLTVVIGWAVGLTVVIGLVVGLVVVVGTVVIGWAVSLVVMTVVCCVVVIGLKFFFQIQI
jgi:hypothetical protein